MHPSGPQTPGVPPPPHVCVPGQVSQGLPQPSSAQAALPAQLGLHVPMPQTPGVPPPPQLSAPLQLPQIPVQPSLPQFLPPQLEMHGATHVPC